MVDKPETPQDSSMEEILQSIRKIIAEEGDAPAAGDAAAAAPAEAPAAEATSEEAAA